ncbi:MAG TPA: transglycosylase family protein [Acidimicrobiales bacterium]|nr:transglycosylase family protein [Acidimicrobiales bacterium]
MTAGQPANAAPAQPQGNVVQNFMVANNLLKFEHAAYWHVVNGQMVFAKDAAWTAAPTYHSNVTYTPPAAPVQHQAAASSSSSSVAGGVWACIRQHESGGNYSANTGNGYGGAYQFSQSTWNSLGYSGSPASASPATQDAAAQKLQSQQGWGPWPVTSRQCGLR